MRLLIVSDFDAASKDILRSEMQELREELGVTGEPVAAGGMRIIYAEIEETPGVGASPVAETVGRILADIPFYGAQLTQCRLVSPGPEAEVYIDFQPDPLLRKYTDELRAALTDAGIDCAPGGRYPYCPLMFTNTRTRRMDGLRFRCRTPELHLEGVRLLRLPGRDFSEAEELLFVPSRDPSEMYDCAAQPGSPEYRRWAAEREERIARSRMLQPKLAGFYRACAQPVLAACGPVNTVFSPVGLACALAMLAECTDGDSHAQILAALRGGNDSQCGGRDPLARTAGRSLRTPGSGSADGCDDSAKRICGIDDLRTIFPAMLRADRVRLPEDVCDLATSLWLNDRLPCRQETLARLRRVYETAAFCGQPESPDFARRYLAWIRDHAGGRAAGLPDETASCPGSTSAFRPDMALALVSSLFIESKWKTRFKPFNTRTEIFHGAGGPSRCRMMHALEDDYFRGRGFQAVGKELGAGRAWFILPDRGLSPDRLAERREVWELPFAPERYRPERWTIAEFGLPRFKVRTEPDGAEVLRRLGVTEIFRRDCPDFRPLTGAPEAAAGPQPRLSAYDAPEAAAGPQPLLPAYDAPEAVAGPQPLLPVYVSAVQQHTSLEVNEDGILGYSYTELLMLGGCAGPDEEPRIVPVVLDRPFLFFVTGPDGAPLLAGTVWEPERADERAGETLS